VASCVEEGVPTETVDRRPVWAAKQRWGRYRPKHRSRWGRYRPRHRSRNEASLKKFAGIVMLLCGVSAVLVAAQGRRSRSARAFFNPNPELELKQLFPTAAAFSAPGGNPPHVTVYRTDPRSDPGAPPMGFAFWTTDLVPNERGYHGPIRILVGMDMAGILAGVVVDADTEPYGSFSIESPKFAAQFEGKSVRDRFRVGGDIDAVSRATLSIGSATRAIRDSARIAAKALLTPAAAK
jgi:transcriptional regulator of nitric oxide reductase